MNDGRRRTNTDEGQTLPHWAAQLGHVEVLQLLLEEQRVAVNKSRTDGATALHLASQVGLELSRCGSCSRAGASLSTSSRARAPLRCTLRSTKVTSRWCGSCSRARALHEPGDQLRDALSAARETGNGAIVRLLVAHAAAAQVRPLASAAIDAAPTGLLKDLPDQVARAAALSLPFCLAAALGDTVEERAAADQLVSQSDAVRIAETELARAVFEDPDALVRCRAALARARPRSLARAPEESPGDAAARAARERTADAALSAPTMMAAFRQAQLRQLIVRKIILSRDDALVRESEVALWFANLFNDSRLQEFKLKQAKRTRVLLSAMRVLVEERGAHLAQAVLAILACRSSPAATATAPAPPPLPPPP